MKEARAPPTYLPLSNQPNQHNTFPFHPLRLAYIYIYLTITCCHCNPTTTRNRAEPLYCKPFRPLPGEVHLHLNHMTRINSTTLYYTSSLTIHIHSNRITKTKTQTKPFIPTNPLPPFKKDIPILPYPTLPNNLSTKASCNIYPLQPDLTCTI